MVKVTNGLITNTNKVSKNGDELMEVGVSVIQRPSFSMSPSPSPSLPSLSSPGFPSSELATNAALSNSLDIGGLCDESRWALDPAGGDVGVAVLLVDVVFLNFFAGVLAGCSSGGARLLFSDGHLTLSPTFSSTIFFFPSPVFGTGAAVGSGVLGLLNGSDTCLGSRAVNSFAVV